MFKKLRKYIVSALLTISVLGANSQNAGKQYPISFTSQNGLGTVSALQFKPADSSTGKHPLILFFHGTGERGSDPTTIATNSGSIPYLCAHGATMRFTVKGVTSSFIVISPQLPLSFGAWDVRFAKDAYAYAKANLNIDTNRVYVTGLSLGGGACWEVLADSLPFLSKIAAVVPMCGTTDGDRTRVINNSNTIGTPWWCIHSTDDNNALTANGSSSYYYQFYTGYNDSSKRFTYYDPVTLHAGCWQKGSDTLHSTYTVDSSSNFTFTGGHSTSTTFVQNPNIYEWMLSKSLTPSGGGSGPKTVLAILDGSHNINDFSAQSRYSLNDGDTLKIPSSVSGGYIGIGGIVASPGHFIYVVVSNRISIGQLELGNLTNVKFLLQDPSHITHYGVFINNASRGIISYGTKLQNIYISNVEMYNISDFNIYMWHNRAYNGNSDSLNSIFFDSLKIRKAGGDEIHIGGNNNNGNPSGWWSPFSFTNSIVDSCASGQVLYLDHVFNVDINHDSITKCGYTDFRDVGQVNLMGNGIIHENFFKGNWGSGGRIASASLAVNKLSTPGSTFFYNNKVLANIKYSMVQVNMNNIDTTPVYIRPGNYYIDNNTAGNLRDSDYHAGTFVPQGGGGVGVDVYVHYGELKARNNIFFAMHLDHGQGLPLNSSYKWHIGDGSPLPTDSTGTVYDPTGLTYLSDTVNGHTLNPGPAILAGTPLSYITNSFNDVLRPTSGNYDIGAEAFTSNLYFGADSVRLNSMDVLAWIAGSGVYPTVIEIGPQTENAAAGSLSLLFNSGTPKLIKAGKWSYPLKADSISRDSINIFKIRQPNYNADLYAEDISATINAILNSSYKAHIDTTKDINGKYEYIGLAAEERGADAFTNLILWQNGVSFGSNPGALPAKIKKLYLINVSNVYNFTNLTTAFSNGANKIIKYYGKSTDLSTSMHDSLAKYSSGVYQVLKLYPTLSYSQISDSLYSNVGTDSASNIYRNICKDPGFIVTPSPVFRVYPKHNYQLSMPYSDADIGKIQHAYDTTGGILDPINGVFGFGNPGSKSFMPSHSYDQYYSSSYPGRRGLRVLLDLTGSIDENDTTNRFNLNSIWGLSTGNSQGDTLWLYSLDTMFTRPVNDRIKFLARPDSLAPLIGYLITGTYGVQSWQSINTTIRCRYLLIRANLQQHSSFVTWPDYSKLIIYSNNNPVSTQLPLVYTGAYPKHPSYGNSIGTNIPQGYATPQLAFDTYIRGYGTVNGWDSSHTKSINRLFTENTYPDVNYNWYDSLKRQGKSMVWAIHGSNNYVQAQAGGSNEWGVDTFSASVDPENVINYKRVDTLFFNYAAKLGKTLVPESLTLWAPSTGGNGLNVINAVQNGNEDDSHKISPLAYWCRSMMEYDGYEGRYGRGIWGADTTFGFIASPTSSPDTNWFQTIIFLSRIARTDKKIVWSAFDFHDYYRTVDTLDHAASCTELVGATGEAPEKDGILVRHKKIADILYIWLHGDTTKKLIHTEYGYGNYGTAAPNDTLACAYPWDLGNIPSIPGGLDSLHNKANLMSRSEILQCFTPVHHSNE
jgi:poly(3-hydroxybutyrate) depolymerase